MRYADTLRSRRNLFTTGLALVAGLGVFRLDPLISPDQVFAVPDPRVRLALNLIILVALVLFVLGAYTLYTRGRPSKDELVSMSKATGVPLEDLRRVRIPRASDYLAFTQEEEEALIASEGATCWLIRTRKLQNAIDGLAASNARVSNRIAKAGVLIASGYLALVLAVITYSVAIDERRSDHGGDGAGGPCVLSESADERRSEGPAVRPPGP